VAEKNGFFSGPIRLSFSGTTTTVVSTGPSIQPFPASVLTAAGLPPLPLIHGQIVFSVDDQGNVTSIQPALFEFCYFAGVLSRVTLIAS